MAIAFGLLAAVFYGASDFFGGFATKRATMLSVAVISQASGLLCLLCFFRFFGGHLTLPEIGWSLLAGVNGGIGISLLYRALSIGTMGVVSPITAVLAASFPVVVGIVRGDPLHWYQLLGIGLALVAVVMVSLSKQSSGKPEIATTGVKEAIAAGVFIGLFFLMLGLSGRNQGLQSLLVARIASIAFILLLAAATRTTLRPHAKALPMILAVGAVDMAANVLYVLAAQTGALAVAAVLTSLYPASTVVLARLILKEHLSGIQKSGVALALVGVVLISLSH